MMNRILTSLAGFFAYCGNLLGYVQVPAQTSKPILASGFAAIAAAFAAMALVRTGFVGWKRVIGGVLIGAASTSVIAVVAIAWARHSQTVMHAPGAQQLEAFTDYAVGGAVSGVLLACGWLLAWFARRERTSK
jgi:hypothetical protein